MGALYTSLYVFPMQAVFDNSIATTLKSALFLSSRYFGWTVVLLALAILTAIAVILYWPLTGWFVFGLAAFINAWKRNVPNRNKTKAPCGFSVCHI